MHSFTNALTAPGTYCGLQVATGEVRFALTVDETGNTMDGPGVYTSRAMPMMARLSTPSRRRCRGLASRPRRFENWECTYAGKAGLAVALDYARARGMDAIWDRVQLLAEQLRSELAAIPGIIVRDIGAERCGILTFTGDDMGAQELQDALAARAMNVTISTTSSTRFDMEARDLRELMRASVHYYNDESEIARFCAAVRTIAAA